MPRVRTPDTTARKHLFKTDPYDMTTLSAKTGIDRSRLYRRKKKPGKITLDELAVLVDVQEITKEELYQLVTERG